MENPDDVSVSATPGSKAILFVIYLITMAMLTPFLAPNGGPSDWLLLSAGGMALVYLFGVWNEHREVVRMMKSLDQELNSTTGPDRNGFSGND